jgi:hypothetical protein
MEKQEKEEDEKRRMRRVELRRPWTPKPMSLWMSHLSEDDDQRSHSPKPPSVINELFQHLTTFPNQLQPAIQLSALESKVVSLETLVKSQVAAAAVAPPLLPELEPIPPSSESLTQILSDWKKSVEGQWSSVQEEWASERKRLTFACEEWENKSENCRDELGHDHCKVRIGFSEFRCAAADSVIVRNL